MEGHNEKKYAVIKFYHFIKNVNVYLMRIIYLFKKCIYRGVIRGGSYDQICTHFS